jgi:hypothetical protein
MLHRAPDRGKSEQPGHADVVGVVVLHELLTAERVHDRRLERLGQRDDLVVGSPTAGAGEDRDPLRPVEQVGGSSCGCVSWK